MGATDLNDVRRRAWDYAAPRQAIFQSTGIPKKRFSNYIPKTAGAVRLPDENVNAPTQGIRSLQASSAPLCHYRGTGACRCQSEWLWPVQQASYRLQLRHLRR